MAHLALPPALAEVAALDFSSTSHGCDFEPYTKFESPEETTAWFRLYTGNDAADGSQFRIFGTTGAGDYIGFWLVQPEPEMPVTAQPVVYFGSEGELSVIARDLGDFLWMLANGSGPTEALEEPGRVTEPNEAFCAVAEKYAPGGGRATAEILAMAKKEYPGFARYVEELCR
ncbi:hypothetical protein ASPVEDRAFT_47105 [Aspergillus versicolor CBS 583.65]|uniref:Knr4/Smi1-like domain-containing protein n=1 Tax=Aspergillus versicolor CBS 583.65 TaxID=1036611 RepID=A0A1L9Q2C2_ASPVE|nr:uncharacterized protein ASPVEDRAFT_47105 [Aspergillus versicolor CBS 583.65]OJJ07920.1 hypothetical protein ASPVEDRAFT_47105 [Aspergillus versicolor CBS 583.65]